MKFMTHQLQPPLNLHRQLSSPPLLYRAFIQDNTVLLLPVTRPMFLLAIRRHLTYHLCLVTISYLSATCHWLTHLSNCQLIAHRLRHLFSLSHPHLLLLSLLSPLPLFPSEGREEDGQMPHSES